MATKKKSSTATAVHGQKMIEVKLRFWTNNIARGKGKVKPKEAWDCGVVRMERNDAHGIVPGAPIPFHSLLDAGRAIEKSLRAHGITLHLGTRSKKYMAK